MMQPLLSELVFRLKSVDSQSKNEWAYATRMLFSWNGRKKRLTITKSSENFSNRSLKQEEEEEKLSSQYVSA